MKPEIRMAQWPGFHLADFVLGWNDGDNNLRSKKTIYFLCLIPTKPSQLTLRIVSTICLHRFYRLWKSF